MARILEYITINYAVNDLAHAQAQFSALGLNALAANHMPQPPAEITDITFPIGSLGAISLVCPTAPSSSVQRFLDRRGEGCFSLAVRVDDLHAIMNEWSAVGIEWVLPQPYKFPPGTAAARYQPDELMANWVKPSSLHGLLLECFEFGGEVREIMT